MQQHISGKETKLFPAATGTMATRPRTEETSFEQNSKNLVSVTSEMLASASTYCKPFCITVISAPGGTKVPFMLV